MIGFTIIGLVLFLVPIVLISSLLARKLYAEALVVLAVIGALFLGIIGINALNDHRELAGSVSLGIGLFIILGSAFVLKYKRI